MPSHWANILSLQYPRTMNIWQIQVRIPTEDTESSPRGGQPQERSCGLMSQISISGFLLWIQKPQSSGRQTLTMQLLGDSNKPDKDVCYSELQNFEILDDLMGSQATQWSNKRNTQIIDIMWRYLNKTLLFKMMLLFYYRPFKILIVEQSISFKLKDVRNKVWNFFWPSPLVTHSD